MTACLTFFPKYFCFIFSKVPSSPPRHNNGSSSNSNGTKLEPENVANEGATGGGGEKPDLEESDGNMEISSESESETPKKSRKKKRKKEKNSKSSKVRFFRNRNFKKIFYNFVHDSDILVASGLPNILTR